MSRPEGDWIKLYRKIKDSKVWYYTHAQYRVWTTILLSVNWGETWARLGGEEIKLEPGEMVTSTQHLSDESMTSKNIVRKTLNKLERDDMITCDRTNQGTRLKVLNWAKYQEIEDGGDMRPNTRSDQRDDTRSDTRTDPQGDPQTDTQGDTQGDTRSEDTIRNKEDKEEEEGKENTPRAREKNPPYEEIREYWNELEHTTVHVIPADNFQSNVDRILEYYEVEDIYRAFDNLNSYLENGGDGFDGMPLSKFLWSQNSEAENFEKFVNADYSEQTTGDLIDHVRKQVKEVSGEWPDLQEETERLIEDLSSEVVKEATEKAVKASKENPRSSVVPIHSYLLKFSDNGSGGQND